MCQTFTVGPPQALEYLGRGPLCAGRRYRLTLDVMDAMHASHLMDAAKHGTKDWSVDDHKFFRDLRVAGGFGADMPEPEPVEGVAS